MNKIFSIIGIIAVLFVSVQYAEAEEVIILEGMNEDIDIFITIEGNESVILLDIIGLVDVELIDSKLKIFKSGGFSLKNVEEKTAIWGHEYGENQYKLFIHSTEGNYRIIVDVLNLP